MNRGLKRISLEMVSDAICVDDGIRPVSSPNLQKDALGRLKKPSQGRPALELVPPWTPTACSPWKYRPRSVAKAVDVGLRKIDELFEANIFDLRPCSVTLESVIQSSTELNTRSLASDGPSTSSYKVAAQYFSTDSDLVFLPFQDLIVDKVGAKSRAAYRFDSVDLKRRINDYWTESVLRSDASTQSLSELEIEFNMRTDFVEQTAQVLESCICSGRVANVVTVDFDGETWMKREGRLLQGADAVFLDSVNWEVERETTGRYAIKRRVD